MTYKTPQRFHTVQSNINSFLGQSSRRTPPSSRIYSFLLSSSSSNAISSVGSHMLCFLNSQTTLSVPFITYITPFLELLFLHVYPIHPTGITTPRQNPGLILNVLPQHNAWHWQALKYLLNDFKLCNLLSLT